MDEKGLGARLQGARQAAGFTQQQLCQKSGLSYSTLAKIERGAIKSPSIFTIQQIAAALDTSVDVLLGSSGDGSKKQSKSGISFVYFDINGCLVHFAERAFAAIAEDTGVNSDLVEAAYLQYNDAVCKGIMPLDEFNSTLARCFEVEAFDWSAYYLKAIVNIEATAELINWASRYYKVGLLTNIMPGLVDSMKEKQLIPDITYDAVIDSSEVKLIKPDPAIYQIAAEASGCPASEILFVDDTKINLMAAERAGWQTLLFNDFHPDESVRRVKEVLAF